MNAHHQAAGFESLSGEEGGVCDSTLPYSCVYELSRFLYGAGRGGGQRPGRMRTGMFLSRMPAPSGRRDGGLAQ